MDELEDQEGRQDGSVEDNGEDTNSRSATPVLDYEAVTPPATDEGVGTDEGSAPKTNEIENHPVLTAPITLNNIRC